MYFIEEKPGQVLPLSEREERESESKKRQYKNRSKKLKCSLFHDDIMKYMIHQAM